MKTFFFPNKPMEAEEWRELMMYLGITDGMAHGFACTYDITFDRIIVNPGAVFYQGALHSLRKELRIDYLRPTTSNTIDSVVLFADNNAGETRIEIILNMNADSSMRPIPPAVDGDVSVYVLFSVVYTAHGMQLVDHRFDDTINRRLFIRDDSPDLSGHDGISKGGTGAATGADAAENLGAAKLLHTHNALDLTSGVLGLQHGGVGGDWNQSADGVAFGSDSGNSIQLFSTPPQYTESMLGAGKWENANNVFAMRGFSSPVGVRALTSSDNLNDIMPVGKSFWMCSSSPQNSPPGELIALEVVSDGITAYQMAVVSAAQ